MLQITLLGVSMLDEEDRSSAQKEPTQRAVVSLKTVRAIRAKASRQGIGMQSSPRQHHGSPTASVRTAASTHRGAASMHAQSPGGASMRSLGVVQACASSLERYSLEGGVHAGCEVCGELPEGNGARAPGSRAAALVVERVVAAGGISGFRGLFSIW